jgi:hypothetical protein
MTEPCIRRGQRPADPACDWLHCEPCWQDMCDEVAEALAECDATDDEPPPGVGFV